MRTYSIALIISVVVVSLHGAEKKQEPKKEHPPRIRQQDVVKKAAENIKEEKKQAPADKAEAAQEPDSPSATSEAPKPTDGGRPETFSSFGWKTS